MRVGEKKKKMDQGARRILFTHKWRKKRVKRGYFKPT